MVLYYGLTNYHLLCSIIHKIIYNPKEKAIFVSSQGILKNRIDSLKKSNIFNEVYYIEDTELRNNNFNVLNENSSISEIENVAKKFVYQYKELLPFKIEQFDDIYLAADHGVLGIYILIKKYKYMFLEDGRGIYSNWKILDNLLKIKNPGLRTIAYYYGAYGRNKQIKKKYIAFDSQNIGCNFNECIDFDIDSLLDELSNENINKIFNVFDFKTYKINNKKSALILTQRFSTYKLLNMDDCVLLYALLSDFFVSDCKIYLKPHPADKCEYNKVFKNHVVLDKEIPSELIKFLMDKKFDIGISTYSSAINSLKKHINTLYNIDDSIVKFKDRIFKLYTLFEFAKFVDAKIDINNQDTLEQFFKQCYNLNEESNVILSFMQSNTKITVKEENFKEANYVIKIKSRNENKLLLESMLDKIDYLYLNTNNLKLLKNPIEFEINKILKISKVHIVASIERIEKEKEN